MPTPEFTPAQIAERERIEQQYDGAEGAEAYYGHLQKLLIAVEKRIREGYTPQIPEEVGYFEKMRDSVMARMQALGIPTDLAGYESGDEEPFSDLRE